MNFLFKILLNPSESDAFNFNQGYVAGVIAVLILLLLVKIIGMPLWRFFFPTYPKRSKGIGIDGENGELFISANAIADLIGVLEGDFDFISINKVVLFDCKTHFALRINIVFDIEGGNLPSLTQKYQEVILKELHDTFGIESVKQVNIKMDKARSASKKRF